MESGVGEYERECERECEREGIGMLCLWKTFVLFCLEEINGIVLRYDNIYITRRLTLRLLS